MLRIEKLGSVHEFYIQLVQMKWDEMTSLCTQVRLDKVRDEWLSMTAPIQMETTTPQGTIHIQVPSLLLSK